MSIFPCLVADIGGTNARFSVVSGYENGAYQLTQTRDLRTSDYATFELCLDAYMGLIDGARPLHACVALAGPVIGDSVELTNVSWSFSIAEVKAQVGLVTFCVLNDFAALAYAVPHLCAEDLLTVISGRIVPDAAKAIVGPGTGLGVAGLVRARSRWVPVPGEGGHVAFAAQSPREMAIAAMLQEEGYLCAEALISGPGLVNMYNALARLEGMPARLEQAAQVTALALEGHDSVALEALELFFLGLGTVVGDAVVMYAAQGGVYLGGGVLPRVVDHFVRSGFESRMKRKGVQSNLLSDIPVFLITHSHPALIGAAAWLNDYE